jgi:hypothetical protein
MSKDYSKFFLKEENEVKTWFFLSEDLGGFEVGFKRMPSSITSEHLNTMLGAENLKKMKDEEKQTIKTIRLNLNSQKFAKFALSNLVDRDMDRVIVDKVLDALDWDEIEDLFAKITKLKHKAIEDFAKK